MIVEQLVAQVWAIMTNTDKSEEIVAVAQLAYMSTGSQKCEIICYKCAGPHPLSRNCLLRCSEVATD